MAAIGSKVPDLVLDKDQWGDELAKTIPWTACSPGGANFRTHRLVAVSQTRMEFRAGIILALFAGFFVISGIVAPALSLYMMRDLLEQMFYLKFALPMGGLLFAAVGIIVYRKYGKPSFFDKETGLYSVGWGKDKTGAADSDMSVRVSDIHAIQLIAEMVGDERQRFRSSSENSSPFLSYELNLVTHEGKRYTVIDHGSRNRLIEDGEALGRFLGVPVWNGILG